MERFHPEAYVAAAAPSLGLSLTPLECMQVAAQFARIQTFARLVLDGDLAPEDELAPKFEP